MNDQLDMLICVMPKINPDAPTVGPAVLKSHLMSAGFSCEVVDLNIWLYNAMLPTGDHEEYWFRKDHVFSMDYTGHDISDASKDIFDRYQHVFDEWIKFFKEKNPRWIGLSLLSVFSQAVSYKLSLMIREHLPQVKIVWGGAQIEHGVDLFIERKIMDHYVFGDGELSVVELLKGNLIYSGINSLKMNQINDLTKVMLPNYDDIRWEDYHNLDEFDRPVYITGSRGCVKRCTFCNVSQIWPEYRFRSGRSIASEIINVKEKYGRNTFMFTDSLINGSMKAFRDMLHELSDYRKINDDFTWTSQWIIRNRGQSPESDYQLMKESGCSYLQIGVESFSQDVRYHMGKKFTDEDMWWCFDMLRKYKIRHVLLMIVGYPTETEEDHQHTLETIHKLFRDGYARERDPVTGMHNMRFSFGNTLMLSQGQPLWEIIKNDVTNFKSLVDWDYKDNTLDVRIRRFKEVNDLIGDLTKSKDRGWLIEKALLNYDRKKEGTLPKDRWEG